MRSAVFVVILIVAAGFAQDAARPVSSLEEKSVTVPITLDQDRVMIDEALTLPDGATLRVRAWIDSGNPDLYLSRRLATVLNLKVSCDDKSCSAPPPKEVQLGGMTISLSGIKQVRIPLRPIYAAAVVVPGMNAEMNLPSSILRNYDVLIDFPEHKLTLAQPGNLKFRGVKTKILVAADSGLVQVPSQIDNKKYDLGLDVGSSMNVLSPELFDKLFAAHAAWPHMTGAVGPANSGESGDETKRRVMRLERLQYGPLFLTNVAVAESPGDQSAPSAKSKGAAAGVLGSEALLNYRVGLDYAHSAAYFEIGRTFNVPDFDVIGLILRAEDDGRFTIVGIADYDGSPSVPRGQNGVQPGDRLVAVNGIPTAGASLGQVWAMLGGEAGKERTLTVERAGKQINVAAKIRHFLGDAVEGSAEPSTKN
jgi:hypothetical protein